MTRPQSGRRPFGHGEATPRQRQAWEAVQRLGSQGAASREMGITQGALQSAMLGYQHAMGITGDLPGILQPHPARVPRGTGLIALLRRELVDARERIAALEDENHRLADRLSELESEARPFAGIHAKLDALLARPAGAPPMVTHRRIVDGGMGGRRERRERVA